MVDTELAWQLADAAKGHLDAAQRNEVYIAIGVGDSFSAARFLLQTIVRAEIAVRTEVILQLNRWVDSYRDHPDEARLRELIRRVAIEPFDDSRRAPAPPRVLTPVMRYRPTNRRTVNLRTLLQPNVKGS